MKGLFRTFVLILVMAVAATTAFAEGGQEAPQEVKLAYVNWEEGVAWTHFFQAVLEDEMGYDVSITAADAGPAFASVSSGDQDFYMEAWLPGLHEPYFSKGTFVKVSTIYEEGVTSLIVPQYMYDAGVTTISDLRDEEVAERLDYQITGIDAGAGMMIKTEDELIPAYGLDDMGYELLPSSSPAMLAAIESAIANEEYIVGMGWQPHSMFGRYPLQILEQDEEQIWAVDDILILGRPGIEEDLPEVVEFFDNALWTNDTIGALMVHINNSDLDTLDAAREWKNENRDIWEGWLPN